MPTLRPPVKNLDITGALADAQTTDELLVMLFNWAAEATRRINQLETE